MDSGVKSNSISRRFLETLQLPIYLDRTDAETLRSMDDTLQQSGETIGLTFCVEHQVRFRVIDASPSRIDIILVSVCLAEGAVLKLNRRAL